MNRNIELINIRTEKNRIYYEINDNSGMNLLRKKHINAWIQYDNIDEFEFDLSKLPLSILSIPISLYLLPITYYFDVDLILPIIDKNLYDNLESIYNAYAKIYGTLPVNVLYKRGGVSVHSIQENTLLQNRGFEKVVFFSGGVDACSAGVNNSGKTNILVSIPSIESQAKNEGALRKEKYNTINNFSKVTDSPWVLISNNFNDDIFNNKYIQKYLKQYLKTVAFNFDGWFGIKYIANMCSVAPFAFGMGINELIMGSSFEQLEDKKIINLDGSNPELAGSVKFAGIHFGEYDEPYTRRQKKVENVIKWCNARNSKIKFLVCFDNREKQCCKCEKCVRTQLNILTVGENPKEWGFDDYSEKKLTKMITHFNYWESNPCWLWDNIDVIDSNKEYKYCNHLMHWLKKIGYKDYCKKANQKHKLKIFVLRIIKFYRWPYYIIIILKKIFRGIA